VHFKQSSWDLKPSLPRFGTGVPRSKETATPRGPPKKQPTPPRPGKVDQRKLVRMRPLQDMIASMIAIIAIMISIIAMAS
jgi:hypothetical protein